MTSLQKTIMMLLLAAASAAEIRSGSSLGQKVLSKARPVNEGRQLDNQYTQWMTGYSLKYAGCHSVPQFEREEGIRSTLLAKFKLCPEDQCGSCPNAGEYIVEMRDFVEAYQDAQMSMHEYECETQQETCEYQCQNGYYNMDDAGGDDDDYFNNYNQNGNNNNNNNQNGNNNNNEEYCYYKCMSAAGLSYCDNDNGNDGNGDMNVEEMAECRMLGEGNNNNNNNGYYNANYQVYYVGAYCTNSGVYVGTFTDAMCSNPAPSGTYERYSGGYSLPSDSLVGTDCLSCKWSQNDNNNNNNNGNNNNGNNYNYYQVSEVCEQLYEDAGKCEKNMNDKQYKNNGACDLMHGTLARLDAAFHNKTKASVVFAWLFGIGFFVLGGYVFFLHKKIIKAEDQAEIGKYFGAHNSGAGAALS